MRVRWNLALLLAVVTLFAACGKARLSSSGDQDDIQMGRDGAPADAGPTPDIGGDPYRPPPDELGCLLIPSVGGDIFVGVEGTVELGVYQFSLDSGEPMEGERVQFGVLEGSADARLSAVNVTTDPDGLATVRLTAGLAPGVATVRAFSPCANSLDIEVEILELPTGDLRVSFNYPFRDVYDVSPVVVSLFLPDTLRCRDLAPGEIVAGEIATAEATSVDGNVVFRGLMVDQDYTLVAAGMGTWGERAAQGCADNVRVDEDVTTNETVDLYLLPLNPVGLYEVISHWDFTEAIAESGTVGQMIVSVLDIFENPGYGIQDFILDLVEDYVGGIISGTIGLFLDLTGLDDVIAGAINDLISSSPLLSDIVTIGRDLRSIIAELEVISHLEIGKLGSDYEVFGVDNWIGLALYWRLGCTETDPPDCGRIPIILDTIDLGILRGEWTGRVIGYNQLDIDRHPIDFDYGRLILYVLENLVLPAITGDPAPVTLEDLMAAIFNCAGIGDFVAGGDGSCRCALGACICDTDVEGFCDSFISLMFGSIFRGFVETLSFDAVLDMRGSCTLVNNNPDLMVDELSDGEYFGNMNINGSSVPFTADFAGTRIGD